MPGGGYFKTNYADDLEIGAFNTRFRRFWLGIFLACALTLPWLAPPYWVHLIILVMLFSIGSLALNLLTGYTGLVSLGHAAFIAAGAFTVGILAVRSGLPLLMVVPAAAVVGAILGLITGLPALRLRGIYIILSTVAIFYIVSWAVRQYQASGGYEAGIPIPPASIGTWVINTTNEWYYFLFGVTLIATLFFINLVRSGVGRAFMAVRDRDIAAEALGINLAYYKLLSFALSSAVAAIAGAFAAYYNGFVEAGAYDIWLGISYIAAIIIGGLGSILGSFLGAAFVVLLPYIIDMAIDLLALPPAVENVTSAIQLTIYGLFVVLFLVLEPQGLTGIWRRIRNYFELWPFKYARASATKV